MKNCFTLILAFVLLAVAGSKTLWGAPVKGEEFNLKQPDGTRLKVRIWGDEFYQVVESLDGYTLVRDPQTKWIRYAKLSPNKRDLLPTDITARATAPFTLNQTKHIRILPEAVRDKVLKAKQRFDAASVEATSIPETDSPLSGPTTGTVQGICLIIDFSDEVGTIAPSEVSDFCNEIGYTGFGNNGSVRDYYYDVSDGALTYTNYVPTVYYRALNPKSYYDDPTEENGPTARELILEALNAMEDDGFDFSLYDADGDGVIDALNAFYAGTCDSGWAMGLWPHSWTVSFSADGVSTYKYQITDMGSSLELRTFCHENGHMLCDWPDLYDYDYDSNGAGDYCIMAYGGNDNNNPVEPCGYLRAAAGWCTVNVLDGTAQTGLTVMAGVNSIFKFPHPVLSNEYYLIENRYKTSRDAGLPDSGIAIWHVDEYGSNDNQEMTESLHYEATLVQADGLWDLENDVNYGDADDLWHAPDYTTCGATTSPNTNWWNSSTSGLNILNVSTAGSTMTFDVADAGFVSIRSLSPLPDATVGLPYSVTLEAEGGTTPYTWTISPYKEEETSAEWGGGGTAKNWRSDDRSWQYNLPWSFPFYGTNYTSMKVCSNGFVDFVNPTTDYSNSAAELIDNIRIAPLWDDLVTNGSAQSDEDIYVTETENSVTIRWCAETWSSETPVNVELVLYSDGRIGFNYGTGNTSLTPTIGISSGDGTNYLLSQNDGLSIISSVSSLITQQTPPPGLSLDSATGALSGTPSEEGLYTFPVRVTDSSAFAMTAMKSFELSVLPSGQKGDFDEDGDVDFWDFMSFIDVYGLTDADPGWSPDGPTGDFDENGSVDFWDYMSFIDVYGT